MSCKIICVACEWSCVAINSSQARKCAAQELATGKHDNCGVYAVRIFEAPSYAEIPLTKKAVSK